jgi:hypothetical protein
MSKALAVDEMETCLFKLSDCENTMAELPTLVGPAS